jgi:hypothetical protein
MSLIMLAVVLVPLLAVVAMLAARRRDDDRDLVTSQLRAVARPEPAATGGPAGVAAGPGAAPDLEAGGLAENMDVAVRGRVELLVAHNRRMQAINLIRESTGCRLADAKAVVDRLTAGHGLPASQGRPAGVVPPAGPQRVPDDKRARRLSQFPPGYDMDVRRPGPAGEPR